MRQLGSWSFHWYRVAARFFPLFLALILLYSLFGASSGTAAEKEEKKVLRVAFVQLPGFTQTAEDGTRYGVVVDYLNEIAKYTGWEYEYVDTEGTGFLDGFSNGEYDLMGATYYLPEMTEYYAYPDYSCGSTKSILLARHDDERIKGFEARYLDGKTIGVYTNANENIRRLEEFLKMNGIDCRLKRYTLDQLIDGKMYAYLENGEVDLLLENAAGNDDRFRVVASFDAQPHYIVTTPDRPEVLEGLNMALEKILDANPNFAEERYAANFPKSDQAEVFLNAEEQAYIQEKQVITVAVPGQFHPLVCLREKDMIHSGLVPDMLDKVTNFSGLRFEYVFTDSYTGALELVQQGQADMAGFYLDGENSALQMGLSLTKSYVTLDNLIVRNKFVSYPGAGLRCTVLDGRKLPNTVHADQVTYYSDISKALSAVNRGEQDFAYGLSVRMEQQIQKNYLSNVVPVTLFNDSSKVSFALAKPAPPQLLTILNKAIYHLTEEEKNAIVGRNLISIGSNHFSLVDHIYSNPVLVISIICVCLVLVILIILAIARFRIRAAVMSSRLERTQAESRAKGEFLSRMSHEIRTPMNAVVGLADLTSRMENVPEEVQRNLAQIRASARYLLGLINDILDMSRIDKGMLAIAKHPFSLTRMLRELENMMSTEAMRRNLALSMEIQVQHDALMGDEIRLRQVLTNLLSNAVKFTASGGHVKLTATETRWDGENATFSFHVTDNGAAISPEDRKRIFDAFEQAGASQVKSMGTGLGLPISRSIVALMGGELLLKSGPVRGNDFYFDLTLPLGSLPREIPSAPSHLLDGVRLLLAEDNALNAEIAAEILKIQGAQVIVVENGKQAVEVFSESAPGELQAVLMDVKMPLLDGLEATQMIRRMERPDARRIPIIAITANSFQEDVDAATAAGMDGFITKPIDINYLYKVLYEALHREEDGAAPVKNGAGPDKL